MLGQICKMSKQMENLEKHNYLREVIYEMFHMLNCGFEINVSEF